MLLVQRKLHNIFDMKMGRIVRWVRPHLVEVMTKSVTEQIDQEIKLK